MLALPFHAAVGRGGGMRRFGVVRVVVVVVVGGGVTYTISSMYNEIL